MPFIKWSFDAMKNRRGLLQLEGLTERIVPAVAIRAIDGDLVISGIHNTGTLTINVTGDNEVTINDGGTKNRGTYAVDGDLILNLSNRNDTVVINFTTDSRLDGFLPIWVMVTIRSQSTIQQALMPVFLVR
jgi:hypothetical protein